MPHHNKYFALGIQKAKDEKFGQAVAAYTEALKLEPQNAEIYFNRALALHLDGKSQEAMKDFDKAVSLDPANPFRYSSRAFVRAKFGDLLGAVDDYKKAIDLDPQDAVAHNNLGLLQEKAGRKEQAQEHFKKADALTQNDKHERPANFPPIGNKTENTENQHLEENTKHHFSEYWKIIKTVFLQKDSFKEFITFLKNGLKIKE